LVVNTPDAPDYYYKFDESPFYLWSSSLKDEFDDDIDLYAELEASKAGLQSYFQDNCTTAADTDSFSAPSSTQYPITVQGSPQKNFTAHLRRKARASVDELYEFWSLTQEDFETCDPVKWWVGRRAQFRNLFRLARDIMSIPGSAVVVERVFSSGRETIALRRAKQAAETIRILMLVK